MRSMGAIEVDVDRRRRRREGSYCMQAASDAMLDITYCTVLKKKRKKKD
jgi:hypothetical protein